MSPEPRTLAELSDAYRARQLTALAVTERCLHAIAEHRSLNAFITVLDENARRQARQADEEMAAGRYRGPLHGVPMSLKDLIDLEGTPTTAASRVRAGHRATSDAVVVTRLRDAGAVFIGKTNLHEFALGTTNEDSAFGPARHPLDPSRSPGGSSGGSAVSVLAGMAYASIGSDTGGSIRIPASACGLVGLKPTLGEIPTAGVVPLSETLDHIGPICRSVGDAAIVYAVLAGASMPLPAPETNGRRLRLGVIRGYFTELLDPDVEACIGQTHVRLREAGAELRDVSVAHSSTIADTYTAIVLSEAAVHHATTLERCAADYTPNVRLRLESGRQMLAGDYVRALAARHVLTHEVDEALAGLDGLLLPSLPIPAPTIGQSTVRLGGSDEQIRSVTLRLTQLFNLTGHPAISMPCGRTPAGLPVGLQVVGHRGRTAALLGLARRIEPLVDPSSIASNGCAAMAPQSPSS
jgi:aspartyl-tRNA(Asn)/glutamyl-tRNA(Gln) amidotransferase subunit A